MSNVYNVFNTTSEHEFSRFLDKLDLTTNELINLTYIAENNSLSLNDRRTKILELMAGSSDGNYELCVEQFNKSHKQRVLKESSQLNLNQIMELNDLVSIVANKLSAPNCMKGLYNIIKGKLGSEVANTFLGMVQQSSVNDSNLKFNTDLQVNGKNLADMIYQIKNEIEMFTNSVECEKEEVTESVLMERLFPELNEFQYQSLLKITTGDWNGKADAYTKWLGNLTIKGDVNPIKKGELIHIWQDKLNSHRKLRKAGKVKDIMQYKSWKEMEHDVDEALNTHTFNSDIDKKAQEGFKIIAQKDGMILGHILNREAAIKYGKGTKWCTSSINDDTHYNNYTSDGSNLFYLIDKNNLTKSLGIHAKRFKNDLTLKMYNTRDNMVAYTGSNTVFFPEYNYHMRQLSQISSDDSIEKIYKIYQAAEKGEGRSNFALKNILEYLEIPMPTFKEYVNRCVFYNLYNSTRSRCKNKPLPSLAAFILRLCYRNIISFDNIPEYISLLKTHFGVQKTDHYILKYIEEQLNKGGLYGFEWTDKDIEKMKQPSIKLLNKLFHEYLQDNKFQTITESYSKYKQVVDEISKVLDDVSNINVLKTVSQKVDELFKKVKNMNEANQIAELKSKIETKLGSLTDTKPQIEECVAQQVVSSVCEDDTFNGLLQSLRPTVINITVNKEGDMDETICNPAETLKALASHINCQKSDCAENNLEELQTVNTLLSSLSNYFEATLTESVDLSKDEVTQNDLRIIDEYDIRPSKEWKIKGISRSFHVESYAVNKNGHVIFNIEYIGEDRTGINWGIITADSFDEMMKDGRLTCLTPSEEEWDGEDDEELMENNNMNQNLSDYDSWDNVIVNKVNGLPDYDSLPNGTYLVKVSDIEIDDDDASDLFNEEAIYIEIQHTDNWGEEIDEAISNESGFSIDGFTYEVVKKMPKTIYNNDIDDDYWDGDDEELTEQFSKKPFKRELKENNNVLPSGTYNIIVSNIEVDDYEEGEYNIHGEAELTINHEISNDLDEEIKEAILEDMGEPINGSIRVIDYDYQIVDKNNKGKLEEDTVYDHSWYEVKGQKYPKRTKNGVEGLPIEETASVGATCAGSVSGFAKPLGSKPKKKKKSTIELDMFKESVQNGLHSALEINGKMVAYRIFEGKGYLYIDNAILKATNKEAILEAIDDIYNDCLETPVLEGFTPYQLEILMEDDMNTNTIITPEEKKEQQDELDSQIQLNPNLKVGYTDENSSNVEDNQELVGVDDSDMNNKKYVVRDPQSGKVKVANASQIKVIGN